MPSSTQPAPPPPFRPTTTTSTTAAYKTAPPIPPTSQPPTNTASNTAPTPLTPINPSASACTTAPPIPTTWCWGPPEGVSTSATPTTTQTPLDTASQQQNAQLPLWITLLMIARISAWRHVQSIWAPLLIAPLRDVFFTAPWDRLQTIILRPAPLYARDSPNTSAATSPDSAYCSAIKDNLLIQLPFSVP